MSLNYIKCTEVIGNKRQYKKQKAKQNTWIILLSFAAASKYQNTLVTCMYFVSLYLLICALYVFVFDVATKWCEKHPLNPAQCSSLFFWLYSSHSEKKKKTILFTMCLRFISATYVFLSLSLYVCVCLFVCVFTA